MSEAAATTTAAPAVPNSSAAPVVAAAAPVAAAASPADLGTVLGSDEPAATTAASTVHGDKPAVPTVAATEAKPGEAKADDKTVPVEYAAFKYPEGYKVDEAGLAKFTEFAKAQGLTQAQAQAMLDKGITEVASAERGRVTKLNEVREGWRNELKADKEYGGDKLAETHALARKAVASQKDAGVLKDLLNRSGFGDHPVLVKVFADYGKLLSEDKIRVGAGGQPAIKNPALSLYPNQR